MGYPVSYRKPASGRYGAATPGYQRPKPPMPPAPPAGANDNRSAMARRALNGARLLPPLRIPGAYVDAGLGIYQTWLKFNEFKHSLNVAGLLLGGRSMHKCFDGPVQGWSASTATNPQCISGQWTYGYKFPITEKNPNAYIYFWGAYRWNIYVNQNEYRNTVWFGPASGVGQIGHRYLPQVVPRPFYEWTIPPNVPVGDPRPLPWIVIPWAQPDGLPEGDQNGEPKGEKQPQPGVTTQTVTNAGVRTRTQFKPRAKPRDKEQKMRMPRALAVVLHFANQATELNDLVSNLFDAIPEGPCKNKFLGKNGKSNPLQQAGAVYQCFGSIDWDTAVFNIIWNDITDRVWAKLGIPTKEFGRMYGSNMGANRLLSDAYGDTIAERLKSIEGWLAEQVQSRTGLTLVGKS